MAAILGYALVSTGTRTWRAKEYAQEAGAIKDFTDVKSGKSMDRSSLAKLLTYLREGDLPVVQLDRLWRALAEMFKTVEYLRAQGIALLSL